MDKVTKFIKPKELCYIVFWVVSIFFAFQDKTIQMGAYLGAGFVALILFDIKIIQPYVDAISFEKFSITFKNAKALVQDLKMLLTSYAELKCNQILYPISKNNPTFAEMQNDFNELTSLLKKYNVDENIIEEIHRKNWHEKIYQIYTKILVEHIKCDESFQEEFYSSWCKDGMPYKTPLELDEISADRTLSNKENFRNILSDYRYYYTNKKFKDENRWKEHIKLSPICYFSNKKD